MNKQIIVLITFITLGLSLQAQARSSTAVELAKNVVQVNSHLKQHKQLKRELIKKQKELETVYSDFSNESTYDATSTEDDSSREPQHQWVRS